MELGSNQAAFAVALKSGKYPQGYGHLESPNDFCPLGVYGQITGCNPSGTAYLEKDWRRLGLRSSSGALKVSAEELLAYYPDLPVSEIVRYTKGTGNFSIAILNDSYKVPFAVLGDMIEKHPEWFFNFPA